MTTTDEVMPTLKEIEAGLRARLDELSRTRDDERAKRERAKTKVEDEAISSGNNNSIGETLDDLLIELGLHGRPREVNQQLHVEVRQNVPPHQVRDIYIGGMQMFGAYQDITESVLYTTFRVGVGVMVPRDHDGCACDIAFDTALLPNIVGRLPDTAEIVDTTTMWCGYNSYPYTNGADEESRCRNYAALRAQQKVDAHDSPTVQQCEFAHQYIEPHRHIFYRNGDVTYSVRSDYVPDPPSVMVPGWYGVGAQVGQPIPGTPGEYNPADPHRLLRCDAAGHPLNRAHLHWVRNDGADLTYSRDLHHESNTAERVPGLFTRESDLVGTVYIYE